MYSSIGTPAEEGGGGKIHLIRAGAFKDVDIAMMVDPFKFNAIYPNVLSVSRVDITYSGKASHAAAFPWEGVNALDAAVSAYTAVSLMRQHMKPEWRVHGIITNGGVKVNVIPDTSSLKYMMRAPNNKELDELTNKVKGCFQVGYYRTNILMSGLLSLCILMVSIVSYYQPVDVYSYKSVSPACAAHLRIFLIRKNLSSL